MAIVPDLLRQRAAEAPDAVAVVADGGVSLSYGAWERRSNAAARGLVARGVGRQQPVALVFANRDWVEYAIGYLAVLKAGAVAVPLGPRFAGPELEAICEASGVGLIVGGDLPGWVSLGDLEAGQAGGEFQVPVSPTDLAEILYTSGTTGLPKGVACSHASVLFHEPPPEPQSEPEAGGRATVVHAFPVGTNAGQEVLRLPLRRGDRTVVILATFDPDRYCAVIEEHRVRRLQLVPAMAQLLVAGGAIEGHDLSSVERVVVSSAPCPPALLAAIGTAFPRAAVWNTYALTEAGTARTLNTEAVARPNSVGRPVGATELRIVDDQSRPVTGGATGEVHLRHPGAPPRSYYRDPEATAATFDADGWVRTGDLGYLEVDGHLVLVDRKKDLIIVGGLNVSSVAVENVLFQHPAVADVAVFGIDHPVLGQDVAAAVVVSRPLDVAELQRFARARLGEHQVPHHVVVTDELPRTASGKVRKALLRQQYPAEGSPSVRPAPVEPRTPEEASVLAVWRVVMGRDDFGVEDDFYDLGGHSLAAGQIANRVADLFGVAVGLDAVLEHSTPARLAAEVLRARAGAGAGAGAGGGD